MLGEKSEQESLLAKVSQGKMATGSRRKREFMPDEKKDAMYWEKRRKNNEAAKRSREKRRLNDFALESRMVALSEENNYLKAELLSLKLRFGLITSAVYNQQTQSIQNSLGFYLTGHKSSKLDSPFLSLESFCQDSCYIGPQTFSPKIAITDSTEFIFKDLPKSRKFLYTDKELDETQLHPATKYNPTTHQPKKYESAFKPIIHPHYFDCHFLDKYPYCCSSLYDKNIPGTSSDMMQMSRHKFPSTASRSNEEDESVHQRFLPLFQCGLPDFCDDASVVKTSSALPHKLRIKTKTSGHMEDNKAGSEAAEKASAEEEIHHQPKM
ncbi:nuclear factor interleukin-3-regulated protein [Microcaecilia unicolor]|uniref:Nuclear factor interleukin-3-regulated protein n=1 Tax=Microcaecilia unicolor TaxID=1415580 RepID=A0A6P7ZGD1_9AMPH|nr:nuclear factor interleukin-3-regulated protein-like [Microcaecilia unicolor]XP_030074636.1 nuclear factor interleukin-3-regulated protein-like [Microcaecilia unicolor]